MRAHVLAAGGLDADLAAARRSGLLVRVRTGTYALRELWEAMSEVEQHVLRARGVLIKSPTSAVASHVTAVAVHGAPTWALPLDDVHLTRPDRKGGRRESGVVQHRGELLPHEQTSVGLLPVTTPTRTAFDLLTAVGLEHSLPVFDDFLRRGLTSHQELRSEQQRLRSWPGSRAAEVAVRLADGRHESVGETRCCYVMYLGGVPYAEPQYEVRDRDGRVVARLDFAWPELGVWLEFDGLDKYETHLRPGESPVDAMLREKRRQERIEELTGWRCIRLTWADLQHPRSTVARILRVLSGATATAS